MQAPEPWLGTHSWEGITGPKVPAAKVTRLSRRTYSCNGGTVNSETAANGRKPVMNGLFSGTKG